MKLVGVYSSPERHPKQVINLVYLVAKFDGEVKFSDDVTDVKWFKLGDLPEEMAFDHKQNIRDAMKILLI